MKVSRSSSVSFEDGSGVLVLPLRPSGSNQDLPTVDLPESKSDDVAQRSLSKTTDAAQEPSTNPILGIREISQLPTPTNLENRLSEENLLDPSRCRLSSIELEAPVSASESIDRNPNNTQTNIRYNNGWMDTCVSTSIAACERLGSCLTSFTRQDRCNARDE